MLSMQSSISTASFYPSDSTTKLSTAITGYLYISNWFSEGKYKMATITEVICISQEVSVILKSEAVFFNIDDYFLSSQVKSRLRSPTSNDAQMSKASEYCYAS